MRLKAPELDIILINRAEMLSLGVLTGSRLALRQFVIARPDHKISIRNHQNGVPI